MIKSLRVRLQVWHAFILLLVIIGFGAALYFQMRHSLFRDIDNELASNARLLRADLERSLSDGIRRIGPIPDRPRPDRGPDRGPDGFDNDRPPRSGRPPFRRGSEWEPPYYAVFARDGDRIAQGGEIRRGPGPASPGPGDRDQGSRVQDNRPIPDAPSAPRRGNEFRSHDGLREIVMRATEGHLIVVGRDVAPMLDGLNRFLLPIVLSGFGVLAAGLIGGWWLSGRAIEPLNRISETAAEINANQLTRRIDTATMDSELERLGIILNSMLQRLETSFVQQSRFVADASHELRTPISVLQMHCELALSRDRTSLEYQNTIATCGRATERMRSLTEDLLTLARADAGQLIVRKEPIDLAGIVAESISLLRPLADERKVTIVYDNTTAICVGDANHLSRLVNNVLGNAILYNRPSGQVVLEIAADGTFTTLTIRDTGIGMSEEVLNHLFERFYRANEARSRETGGSGLGLSICKSIAIALDGKLVITSKQNVGTTAVLRLPSATTSENQ